jgi:hypothetical protein
MVSSVFLRGRECATIQHGAEPNAWKVPRIFLGLAKIQIVYAHTETTEEGGRFASDLVRK